MNARYRRRTAATVGVVIVSVVAGGMAASLAASRQHPRCPAGRTLLRTREVMAYTRFHGRTLEVCDRRTGNRRAVASVGYGDHWWPPPAMAFRKRLFAYAKAYNPEATGGIHSVIDLIRIPRYGNHFYGSVVPMGGALLGLSSDLVQVRRLVIRGPSRLAWTLCPIEEGINANDVTDIFPKPHCRAGGNPRYEPGDAKEVVMYTGDRTHLTVLDKSNGIDPDSLRLHGDTLSWLNNGQRRTAQFK